jgi:hypothetical protein
MYGQHGKLLFSKKKRKIKEHITSKEEKIKEDEKAIQQKAFYTQTHIHTNTCEKLCSVCTREKLQEKIKTNKTKIVYLFDINISD